MKYPRILAAALCFAAFSVHVFGFSKNGHMATGSVAYQAMKPEDAAKVAAILEHHPFVKGDWASELSDPQPANVSRAERLFMLAAAWPDEVRSPKWKKKYHHKPWHYVNLKYTPGATVPGPILDGQLLDMLPQNVAAAGNSALSQEERAIAICWLLHQMGDLHQPLHVVAFVNTEFPNGDHGGNEFYFRTKAGNEPTYLHAVWDKMGVKYYTDFAGAQDNAKKLKAAHPASGLPELKARKPDSFADIAKSEVFPLAAKYAYLDGKLDGGDEHDVEASPKDEYVAPSGYLSKGGEIQAQQLALAGYRAAQLLTAAVR